MKISLSVLGLALLAFFSASAQVSVEVILDQNQFLPNESVPAEVRITNLSGQTLHLGADPGWLTFDVESEDGFIVVKNADVPDMGAFDVASSQVAVKRVDLQPYFDMTRRGRYQVVATLRIKDWGAEVSSPEKDFDVINGTKLWSQDFGLPMPSGVTNQAPEVREYTLEEANYLSSELRLYVQVSDETESHVFKVFSIGGLVSFSHPETQLDRYSDLHVLWQDGASTFAYVVVSPDGSIVHREVYDYLPVVARPRLSVDANGDIVVVGGVRRVKPGELPDVIAPDQLAAPSGH